MDENTADENCPDSCEKKEVVVIGVYLLNTYIN